MKMRASVFLSALLLMASVQAKDLLEFSTVVDLKKFVGTPYFVLMKDTIKPKLDEYATNGFLVTDSDTMVAQMEDVSDKVVRGATKKIPLKNLKAFVDAKNKAGVPTTFYQLQNDPALRADKFGVPAFIALVSKGGVAVKMDEETYAYNVNYGTGKEVGDEMSGRSFGAAGSTHKADDASDAAYLKALEKIARPETDDKGKTISAFTKGILAVIIRSDAAALSKLDNKSKAVASDFVAVYTAEQDRRLMHANPTTGDLKSHKWDSALLEVTLLANFHAGQKKVALYYQKGPKEMVFTDIVDNQHRIDQEVKEDISRDAGLVDYWQFSSNPANPGRSGINITRGAFAKLEKDICAYERKKHPELVKAVEAQLKGIKLGGNVFDDVSNFLINFKTQANVKKNGAALIEAYSKFLDQSRIDADAITASIKKP